MNNLLVNIANEDKNAYCVCPNHIQIAINRGVPKPDICMAMIEIQAGINKEFIPWNADKLNPFTTEVKRICLRSGKCLVKLRNNTYSEIFYIPANEAEDEEEGFRGKDWEGCWCF